MDGINKMHFDYTLYLLSKYLWEQEFMNCNSADNNKQGKYRILGNSFLNIYVISIVITQVIFSESVSIEQLLFRVQYHILQVPTISCSVFLSPVNT